MAELGETEASEASNKKGQDEGTMAHKSHLRARETGNERTPGQAAMDIANDSDPDTDAAEHDDDDEHYGDDADDEDDEDDEEPRLKYAYLAKQLQSVYRNGDATSSVLTAGDKMIVGTHNGNIHVLSLPLLQHLRIYHAHSASVTSISVSPFSPPRPNINAHPVNKQTIEESGTPVRSSASSLMPRSGPPKPQQRAVAAIPSNSIYIATSSIDGNVCVASLVDHKDVLLRNFGRPVQAVALSPEYKSDRIFLSGGRAGDLVLTAGGRIGTSTNSTTMGGATATASSWLGSIGLGANTGKDTILHSGEGAISAIKWSLSGKYVAWVNEEGIKIMRSNLHLDSSESDLAWKRISHTDRPSRAGWEEMASVWKARAEWVDLESLETESSPSTPTERSQLTSDSHFPAAKKFERLIVGWGGTVWVIDVHPDRPNTASREPKLGSAEVATILRTDCIISGISMCTPTLIMVLAYIEADDDQAARGHRRQKALEPELRIIDLGNKEEISADTLSFGRFENLSSSDYHMCVLTPAKSAPVAAAERGTLGAISNGLWDATLYPARLFSSSASVRSSGSGDKGSSKVPSSFVSRGLPSEEPVAKEVLDIARTTGVKAFIHSPYDCVVAVQRDLTDRLAWLESRSKFEEAWRLIDEHPEAVGSGGDPTDSGSDIALRSQTSLGQFFDDDRASLAGGPHPFPLAEQEKRRIGERWIEQLVALEKWSDAAQVCGRVLQNALRWEHWARAFLNAGRVDEITPYIPTDLQPPLPSVIYERILRHYVARDRLHFKELLDSWPVDLLDAHSVTMAIEEQLKSDEVVPDSEEWRILTDSLAKLFLAGGHYREALRCYVRLQDAETAMSLIREHRLLDAVSEDIPAFILIRVSREQMQSASAAELEELTAEPIKLLVSEAYTGIVRPEIVVTQLLAASRQLFLFFYLRSLWRGELLPHDAAKPRRGRGLPRGDAANKLAADEGKALIDAFADITLEVFAEYDRPLLMEFLQTSTAYTFETAISICERNKYTQELIYLLSKMGQTKKALTLILTDLKDVSQAISFAKSQEDPDLWEDLLDYSMDKPRFIHGLLVEAGTAIDPIKLVRRIPSGLEIEGLRAGLIRLIREHDLQASISQGAAKVLQSEVALGMDTLRRGQRRGIKFNLVEDKNLTLGHERIESTDAKSDAGTEKTIVTAAAVQPPGRCGGCQQAFHANEQEILVGFACGHVFHLSHVNPESPPGAADTQTADTVTTTRPSPPRMQTVDELPYSVSRTVGPKVTTARLLRDRIGSGCRVCAQGKAIEALGSSES